jgi:serine/threonine protein phosphatase PrpC
MTLEQAKTDKRRNLLLQCVGASRTVDPQIICGTAEKGAYMLCSDGFRHEITEAEKYESLNPINFMSKNAMHSNAKYLIEQVKSRQERDNISVVLIKAE